ncbi:MAG: hypothetical protein GKR91_01660 [Pseudomonadales bacterium]|nr:hypothetical protein [Pseudomonadales bacterium]
MDYFSESNLGDRVSELLSVGYLVSWDSHKDFHPENGYVIEIAGREAISKPCWEELIESSSFYKSESIFLNEIVFTDSVPLVELPKELKSIKFFYPDYDLATKMELRVRSSAKNKRKDKLRKQRLVEAGGFHDQEVIEELYRIQEGKCYYSGDKLERSPKIFSIDHILPVNLGGSDWPENLALVLHEINLEKGGQGSEDKILALLAQSKGQEWLEAQYDFMNRVDKKRKKLGRQFKQKCVKK